MECPDESIIRSLPQCHMTYSPGDLCEADGECGTSKVANNCAHHDVYRRCEMTALHTPPWSPPSAPALPPLPPSPPSLPLPPLSPMPMCGDIVCAAGSSCGSCLRPLNSSVGCPLEASIALLPDCSRVAPGALCEGDGECGTSRILNNCGANHDVYRREPCKLDGSNLSATRGKVGELVWAASTAGGVIAMIALALCFAQRRRRRHAPNQSNSSDTGSGPKAKMRSKAASSYTTAGGVGAASRELRGNDKAEVLVVHNEL